MFSLLFFNNLFFVCLFFLSEQRIYVQGGAASPLKLISALTERGKKDKLKDIEVIHAPTQLDCVFSLPENEGEILYLLDDN